MSSKKPLIRRAPHKDIFLVRPYSGLPFTVDATEVNSKCLCMKCLLWNRRTKKRNIKVRCLSNKKPYDVAICPICYDGDKLVLLRMVERPPNQYAKDSVWWDKENIKSRIKYLIKDTIVSLNWQYVGLNLGLGRCRDVVPYADVPSRDFSVDFGQPRGLVTQTSSGIYHAKMPDLSKGGWAAQYANRPYPPVNPFPTAVPPIISRMQEEFNRLLEQRTKISEVSYGKVSPTAGVGYRHKGIMDDVEYDVPKGRVLSSKAIRMIEVPLPKRRIVFPTREAAMGAIPPGTEVRTRWMRFGGQEILSAEGGYLTLKDCEFHEPDDHSAHMRAHAQLKGLFGMGFLKEHDRLCYIEIETRDLTENTYLHELYNELKSAELKRKRR